jgi:hypothetical protein
MICTIEHSHHQNHMSSWVAETLKLLLFIFLPLTITSSSGPSDNNLKENYAKGDTKAKCKAVTWHFLLPSDQCHSDGACKCSIEPMLASPCNRFSDSFIHSYAHLVFMWTNFIFYF